MMNNQTVSVQTARKLAAAGFPQPAPAPGQWWGNRHGLVYVYGEKNGMYTPVIRHAPGVRPVVDDYFDRLDFRGLVYLPTVEDILSHPIAEGYGVSRQYDTTESGLSWVCCPTEWDAPEMVSAYHETSAAEAAALAWLELNTK